MLFSGFTPNSIKFFENLSANNNKDWFETHKGEYETHVLGPLRGLATALGPQAKAIDELVETAPAVNKTISRIYRDIRFSRDKTPYRTNAWVSFRRPKKQWAMVPEFYFYFTPEEYQFGMGFYAATPDFMERYRYSIDTHPEEFASIVAPFENHSEYKVFGEEYKKKMPNRHGDKLAPWLQKKNLYTGTSGRIDASFFSPDLANRIADSMQFNAKLYHFLMKCAEL